MGVYDSQIATALRLIARYGQKCQWHKDTLVPVDADKPWLGGTKVVVQHEVPIAFLPAGSAASGFDLTKFTSTQVGEFSTVGLMGVPAFEPDVTDVVLRGTSRLVIKGVDALRPAEQVILYILAIV